VANTFLSQPGWNLRGVTRKPSSVTAVRWQNKGIETVYRDMDQPASMRRALKGATAVFGVTDFWQHIKNPEAHRQADEWEGVANEIAFRREIEEGKVRI